MSDSDARYSFAGFSGSLWDFSASSPDGSISLSYLVDLAPGEESDVLLLLIDNDDPTQTPDPVAELILTAPDFRAGTVALPVVY